MNYEDILKDAVRAGHSTQQQIDLHLNIGRINIDEIAVLFESQTRALWFIEAVREFGWGLFNEAEDEVSDATKAKENLDADHYWVKYWFLRHPELDGIRIEVMNIRQGQATLHQNYRNGQVVHASWKCAGTEHYNATQKTLREAGMSCVRSYRSTYGLFSYWGDGRTFPLLKPRLNLRDPK